VSMGGPVIRLCPKCLSEVRNFKCPNCGFDFIAQEFLDTNRKPEDVAAWAQKIASDVTNASHAAQEPSEDSDVGWPEGDLRDNAAEPPDEQDGEAWRTCRGMNP
jgi:hypothetical protein